MRKSTILISLILFLFSFSAYGQIVDTSGSFGGPYKNDPYTVLLLHFDGNLNNSCPLTANGVPHGTLTYLSNTALGLGQCLRLKNDAATDSSYVTIADANVLDMTGNWTIEGWINVFTFGDQSGDRRWVPRLLIKPGEEIFWRPNYWVELWGDARVFQTGFHVQSTTYEGWPAVTSTPNTMRPGAWFHLTFIRDTTRKIIVQMVHDASKKLVFYGSLAYDPVNERTPLVNNNPVHIGWAGGSSNDSWLDGFVDEIRISNIVRNFTVPPLVSKVTSIKNQTDAVNGYVVTADAEPFSSSGSLKSVSLLYNITGTTWNTVAMTLVSGKTYTATIPKQAVGSIVKYYVKVVDNNDMSACFPQDAEVTVNPTYYSFGVYKPNTQFLQLTFEEGTGTPADSSIYKNPIKVFRTPVYSTDSKFGKYSLSFPNNEDSAMIHFPHNPFLNAEQFCVDFWFKGDSLTHAARILNKSAADDWYHCNYEVVIRVVNSKPRIAGRYWFDSTDAQFELRLDVKDESALEVGKWYHVIFERNNDLAICQLRNANDQLLEFKYQNVKGLLPRQGGSAPLTIGKALTGSSAYYYIPPFRGKIDNVKLFNYPAAGLTSVGGPEKTLPTEIQLSQNYPNPFNPTTMITFILPKSQNINLAIYDILGRKVRTLVNEFMHAGECKVKWNGKNDNGKDVSSGVYLYRLEGAEHIKQMKMMLVR